MTFTDLKQNLYPKRHSTFDLGEGYSLQIYCCGRIVNIKVNGETIAQYRFPENSGDVRIFLNKHDGGLEYTENAPCAIYPLTYHIPVNRDFMPRRMLTLLKRRCT